VFAPGRAVLDRVEPDGTGTRILGTSIACAHVSAVLAVLKDAGGFDRWETASALLGATTAVPGHDLTAHGVGQVNWPDLAR
jgi:hypothetical protein